MDKKGDYKNMAVVCLAAAILILLSAASPFTALLTALIAAYFLAYAVAMWDAFGIFFAVICFAVGCALNIKVTAFFTTAFLPLVLTTGYVVKKKLRMRNSVMITSGTALIGIAAAFGVLWLFTGLEPIDYIVSKAGSFLSAQNDYFVRSVYWYTMFIDILTGATTQTAVFSTPIPEAITVIQQRLTDWLNINLVSEIIGFSLLMGLLMFVITRVFVKKKRKVVSVPSFSELTLPPKFWLAYLLSYFFALAGISFGWASFDIVTVTIGGTYELVFMVQALCFLDYLYKRRHMHTAVRVLLHVVITLFIGNLLVWVGLFENIAGIRKRMDAEGGMVL